MSLYRSAMLIILLTQLQLGWTEEQATFTSPRHGLSIKYPLSLAPAPVSEPAVLLLLRDKARGYPTFNVIMQSGPYDFSLGPETHKEKLLHSYRLVGLTETKLSKLEISELSGSPVLKSELSFPNSGRQYSSLVAILSTPQSHFIFTLVCPEDPSPFRGLFEELLTAVVIDNLLKTEKPTNSWKRGYWTLGAVLVLVPLLILIWIGAKKASFFRSS